MGAKYCYLMIGRNSDKKNRRGTVGVRKRGITSENQEFHVIISLLSPRSKYLYKSFL